MKGIMWAGRNGPYRQSERKDMYTGSMRNNWRKMVMLYYAFDTQSRAGRDAGALSSRTALRVPACDHITRQYMKNSLSLSQDETEKAGLGDAYVIRL